MTNLRQQSEPSVAPLIGICGVPGWGKTRLACYRPATTWMLDVDNRGAGIAEHYWNYINGGYPLIKSDIASLASLQPERYGIVNINGIEIDTIALDTVDATFDFAKIIARAEEPHNGQRMYGLIADKMKYDIVDALKMFAFRTGVMVIMNFHDRRYEPIQAVKGENDAALKKEIEMQYPTRSFGLEGSTNTKIWGIFDLVLHGGYDQDKNRFLTGDRQVIAGEYFEAKDSRRVLDGKVIRRPASEDPAKFGYILDDIRERFAKLADIDSMVKSKKQAFVALMSEKGYSAKDHIAPALQALGIKYDSLNINNEQLAEKVIAWLTAQAATPAPQEQTSTPAVLPDQPAE